MGVQPLHTYIDKAYTHLVEIVERLQYKGQADALMSHEGLPEHFDELVWWLLPEEAFSHLLSLDNVTVEACDELVLRLQSQFTPPKNFEFYDFTRN